MNYDFLHKIIDLHFFGLPSYSNFLTKALEILPNIFNLFLKTISVMSSGKFPMYISVAMMVFIHLVFVFADYFRIRIFNLSIPQMICGKWKSHLRCALRTSLCDVYIIKVDGATNHNWIGWRMTWNLTENDSTNYFWGITIKSNNEKTIRNSKNM